MGGNGLRGGIRHGEHDGGIQNEVSGLKPEVVVEVKIRVIFVDVDRSAPFSSSDQKGILGFLSLVV